MSSKNFTPKFLSQPDNSSSFDRIFSDITLHTFKNLVDIFSKKDPVKSTEKIVILKNPQFYNDNFLIELQQMLFQLQQTAPDLRIFAINEEDLTDEQKGQLVSILRGTFDPKVKLEGATDYPELKG